MTCFIFRYSLQFGIAFFLCFHCKSQSKSSSILTGEFPYQQVEYITSKHGLNGSEVTGMTQDTKGFLWFITDNALNRFDGYNFRSYAYDPNDSNSISTGWYFDLAEDKDGLLWISSQFKGLYSFDPRLEKFKCYGILPGVSDEHKLIYSMKIQDDSTIWTSSQAGLDHFNKRTQVYTNYLNYNSSTVPFHHIISLVPDDKKISGNNLWIVSDRGLHCFDTKKKQLTGNYGFPYPAHPNQWIEGGFSPGKLNGETIWIGSDDNGIYGFNVLTKKFTHIRSDRPCRSPIRHINGFNQTNGYYAVMEDHNGDLWTTNDNNEIVFFNKRTNKLSYLPIPQDRIFFLDVPPFIFQDQSKKVWICTNSGLITIDTKQKKFFSLRHDPNDPRSISGNFVYSIHKTRQGSFFVGSSSLDLFDKKTRSFSRFLSGVDGKKISTEGTWDVYEDSKDKTWFVGNFGVILYDPFTMEVKFIKDENGAVLRRRFNGIVEDNNGNYWVANMADGLYKVDPVNGIGRVFFNKKDSINTTSLTTIHKDSKGIIYIGTWENGLICFDPTAEKFVTYSHRVNDPNSISNQSTHLFLEDKNGFIWFGTLGGGINVFDPKTKKFKAFTTADGLVHNSIASLIEDKKGNYWVSTRGGLSTFSPANDPFAADCRIVFTNYDLSDGLPTDQFNMSSAFCDTDGTIYFGTRGSGMIYFHPDDLKKNEFIPPVHITEFFLQNKNIRFHDPNSVLRSPIEFTKEIKLNYRQNTFSFGFAALNYVHSEKNQYAYKLENYDDDWIYTNASKRFATYSNLNPGKYIFKVNGSNNDGEWNRTPTELIILITPPFWQTTLFMILVVLTGMGIIYAFYRYRLGQVLLLQRIRNKIAADLHDDIGSTLNSISVYSEVAKKDILRKEHALDMIGESSRKIIDSMSDIVWSINPENDSFDKIIFRMRSLAYNLLKAKRIDYVFKADENLNGLRLAMQARRNFYLIFKEVLTNLVKYSQADRASVIVSQENKQIILLVRDNGIGFDVGAKHNGNGLNNIRKRADEINAKLHIESSSNEGTTVELNLKA